MILHIGTDCSGIESPIFALKLLKIPYVHEFSSEINKHCIESIKANFNPKIIYGDVKKRKLNNIPNIDLYICGFPCQPFSLAGNRLGINDFRGNLFFDCLKLIKKKEPKLFLLENVSGLMNIDNGLLFKQIINELERLKIYNINYKILNTCDYGIPQSRKRVFIIGILKKNQIKEFIWPEKKKLLDLNNFIDYTDKNYTIPSPRIQKQLLIIPQNSCFIDLAFSNYNYPNSDKISPCICQNSDIWCVPMSRRANIKEYLRLQGFPTTFKQVVSDNQLKKQIGNSISVNILKLLLKEMINCIQF